MNELLRQLNLDLIGLVNFMRLLIQLPLLRGRFVDGTLPLGLFSVEVNHGLERQYQGGIIVSSTYPITVAFPKQSTDATKRIKVEINETQTVDVPFKVWVF